MPTYWLSDSQSTLPIPHHAKSKHTTTDGAGKTEVGIAFSSGGVGFLIFGLILFFDRALLAMGNILFVRLRPEQPPSTSRIRESQKERKSDHNAFPDIP